MKRKTAPPFCPARYGNRQMLLKPIAEPVAAKIKPSLPEKCPRFAIFVRRKWTKVEVIRRISKEATAGITFEQIHRSWLYYYILFQPVNAFA